MKRERIVEFVGGSDEEIAHLRLLMRKGAGQLMDKWRLRKEGDGKVDLLVIDDSGVVGSTVLAAARGSGLRHVRVVDPDPGAGGIETIVRPLSLDKITKLLNLTSFAFDLPPAAPAAKTATAPAAAVPPAAPPPPAVPIIQHNVFDDLFELDQPSRWKPDEDLLAQIPSLDFSRDWKEPKIAEEPVLTEQAEQLFKKDLRSSFKDALKSIRLDDDVGIEATDGHTTGGGSRKDRRGNMGILADTTHTLTIEEAGARHPLLVYLTGKLLPGPSQIETDGVTLTLDPRNRTYYAKGALCVFEECCKHDLRRGDWHGLAYGDFADVKEQVSPRPFAELQWLCVYLDQRPTVGADLDPDTRYRLTQTIELQRDYPRAARVTRELALGSTLSAAAAVARVPLAEARRVAAAFNAVGFLSPG